MASTLPQRITYYKIPVEGETSQITKQLVIAEYEEPLDISGDGMDTRDHTPEDIANYYTDIGIDLRYASAFLPAKGYSVDLTEMFSGYVWKQYDSAENPGHLWEDDDYYFVNDTENEDIIYLHATSSGPGTKQDISYYAKRGSNVGSGSFIGGVGNYGPLWVLAGCKDGTKYRFLTSGTLQQNFTHYYMIQNVGNFVGAVLQYIHDYELEDEYEYDPYEGVDPYEDGGFSDEDPQGGYGTQDGSSDHIYIPGVGSLLSAVDTGFVTIYAPSSISEVKSLAQYMWNADAATLDFWKKLVADPMELIIGMNILPFTVPRESTPENIKVGCVDTGVSSHRASSQYYQLHCGQIIMTPFFNSALDYEPFTRMYVYLPFVGTKELDPDMCTGGYVSVVYNIDIITGSCVCMLANYRGVFAQYEGQCAQSVPVTSANYSQVVTGAMSMVGSAVGALATGGLSMGSQISGAALAAGLTGTAAQHISSMKPRFERGGTMAGVSAQLGCLKPYIYTLRLRQSLARNQNKRTGYPSNIEATLGSLTGFTQVESIVYTGMTCTESELNEIDKLLKEGVIL